MLSKLTHTKLQYTSLIIFQCKYKQIQFVLLIVFLFLYLSRNSDCVSNYVDRVRICDTRSNGSESIYGGASSQKSGWRQKSLSNIDLSSNTKFLPGAGIFSYKDFEAHPFDLCSSTHNKSKDNEIQQDYEDICNVNPKGN